MKLYSRVIASFEVLDKLGRARYFQETFLLADVSVVVVLGMRFLTFSNFDIKFADKKPNWRTYIPEKALPTTPRVEIINKKKFAKAVLNENVEAFVVHVASFTAMIIHLARKA